MSARETVAEKVQGLNEVQAQAVLNFIEELATSPTLTAAELMRLPLDERRRILANQARQAEILYRENPDLIVEDTDLPLSHE